MRSLQAGRFPWRLFLVLWAASVVGYVLVLPYALALLPLDIASRTGLPLPLLVLLQLGQGAILMAVAILAGLSLGRRIGLGAPILQGWLEHRRVGEGSRRILLPPVLFGVLGSLAVLALELLVFQPALRAGHASSAAALDLWRSQPAAWKGLLASFYGGIDEEILCRWFLLTSLAWLGRRVQRADPGRPSAAVLWTANAVAAVLFGLGHLPMTAALVPLTPLVVVRAIVLNGLLGLGFGYLYWTRGIESAILSHFSADLVLHVALAL